MKSKILLGLSLVLVLAAACEKSEHSNTRAKVYDNTKTKTSSSMQEVLGTEAMQELTPKEREAVAVIDKAFDLVCAKTIIITEAKDELVNSPANDPDMKLYELLHSDSRRALRDLQNAIPAATSALNQIPSSKRVQRMYCDGLIRKMQLHESRSKKNFERIDNLRGLFQGE